MLGNNSSIAVPRAHRKLSTYFGPPSADSIRDSGEIAKVEVVECRNKSFTIAGIGWFSRSITSKCVKHV